VIKPSDFDSILSSGNVDNINIDMPDWVKPAFSKYKINKQNDFMTGKLKYYYVHEFFKLSNNQEYNTTILSIGKQTVSSVHPYDESDYFWAYTKNGIHWIVCLGKESKFAFDLKNVSSDLVKNAKKVAERLYKVDTESKIEPRISSY
jgi:hypothetical protein